MHWEYLSNAILHTYLFQSCLFLNYGIVYILIASSSACVLVDVYLQLFHAAFFTVTLVHHLTQMKVQLGEGRWKHKHSWRWSGIDPAEKYKYGFLEYCESQTDVLQCNVSR